MSRRDARVNVESIVWAILCRYIMLADANNNNVLGFSRVSLAEAEVVGYEHPELVDQWASAPSGDKQEAAAGPKVRRCIVSQLVRVGNMYSATCGAGCDWVAGRG
jgi:hypothetical protein